MSKNEESTNEVSLKTREQKAAALVQFQQDWDKVKDDVIAGNLEPAKLKEVAGTLFSHRIATGTDSGKIIEGMIKDCKDANISNENLHKFVSASLSVELDLEKTKVNSTGLMRSSGSTLAASLLSYEASKREFGKDILDVVKTGTDKEIIDAFVDIKIPPYLKDHYGPIIDHYKTTGGQEAVQNAFTNLIFSNLYPALTAANSTEYNSMKANLGSNHPDVIAEGGKMAKIATKVAELSYAAYPTKGDKKATSAETAHPAFDKSTMFDSLTQQFDKDPNNQVLNEQKLKNLKEKAYLRNDIQQERESQSTKDLVKLKETQLTKVEKKTEDKEKVVSKTFAQRFKDFGKKIKSLFKPKEKVENRKPFTVENYYQELMNNREKLSNSEKQLFDKMEQQSLSPSTQEKGMFKSIQQHAEKELSPQVGNQPVDSVKANVATIPDVKVAESNNPVVTKPTAAKKVTFAPGTKDEPITEQNPPVKQNNFPPKLAEATTTIKNGLKEKMESKVTNRPRSDAIRANDSKKRPGNGPSM